MCYIVVSPVPLVLFKQARLIPHYSKNSVYVPLTFKLLYLNIST